MSSENNQTFRKKLWHEIEQIVIHGLAVLILEACLLVIGLATLLLEHIFSDHKSFFILFEQIDIIFALTLLCLFGLYTLLRLTIRLWKGIKEEASEEDA